MFSNGLVLYTFWIQALKTHSLRFIKYIFFSFQKSFHMQQENFSLSYKIINNKSTYVGA